MDVGRLKGRLLAFALLYPLSDSEPDASWHNHFSCMRSAPSRTINYDYQRMSDCSLALHNTRTCSHYYRWWVPAWRGAEREKQAAAAAAHAFVDEDLATKTFVLYLGIRFQGDTLPMLNDNDKHICVKQRRVRSRWSGRGVRLSLHTWARVYSIFLRQIGSAEAESKWSRW